MPPERVEIINAISKIKLFNEFTPRVVLNFTITIRSFVVEQDCVYQDLDFKDQKNILHVLCKKNDKIVAYTRIFF
jgi:ElaA protein